MLRWRRALVIFNFIPTFTHLRLRKSTAKFYFSWPPTAKDPFDIFWTRFFFRLTSNIATDLVYDLDKKLNTKNIWRQDNPFLGHQFFFVGTRFGDTISMGRLLKRPKCRSTNNWPSSLLLDHIAKLCLKPTAYCNSPLCKQPPDSNYNTKLPIPITVKVQWS